MKVTNIQSQTHTSRSQDPSECVSGKKQNDSFTHTHKNHQHISIFRLPHPYSHPSPIVDVVRVTRSGCFFFFSRNPVDRRSGEEDEDDESDDLNCENTTDRLQLTGWRQTHHFDDHSRHKSPGIFCVMVRIRHNDHIHTQQKQQPNHRTDRFFSFRMGWRSTKMAGNCAGRSRSGPRAWIFRCFSQIMGWQTGTRDQFGRRREKSRAALKLCSRPLNGKTFEGNSWLFCGQRVTVDLDNTHAHFITRETSKWRGSGGQTLWWGMEKRVIVNARRWAQLTQSKTENYGKTSNIDLIASNWFLIG